MLDTRGLAMKKDKNFSHYAHYMVFVVMEIYIPYIYILGNIYIPIKYIYLKVCDFNIVGPTAIENSSDS